MSKMSVHWKLLQTRLCVSHCSKYILAVRTCRPLYIFVTSTFGKLKWQISWFPEYSNCESYLHHVSLNRIPNDTGENWFLFGGLPPNATHYSWSGHVEFCLKKIKFPNENRVYVCVCVSRSANQFQIKFGWIRVPINRPAKNFAINFNVPFQN